MDLNEGRYFQVFRLEELILKPRTNERPPKPFWAGTPLLETMTLRLQAQSTGPLYIKSNWPAPGHRPRSTSRAPCPTRAWAAACRSPRAAPSPRSSSASRSCPTRVRLSHPGQAPPRGDAHPRPVRHRHLRRQQPEHPPHHHQVHRHRRRAAGQLLLGRRVGQRHRAHRAHDRAHPGGVASQRHRRSPRRAAAARRRPRASFIFHRAARGRRVGRSD